MWQSVAGYTAANHNKNGSASGKAAVPQTDAPSPAPNGSPSAAKDPPALPPQLHATNAAVQRCVLAYQQAMTAAGGPKAYGAIGRAEEAFRNALPDITDRASAADFIACIVKGIALHIFIRQEGPRLMSGARAIAAMLPSNPDRMKPGPKPKS